MVFIPLDYVLRGFPVTTYFVYVSPKNHVCPAIAFFKGDGGCGLDQRKKSSFMNGYYIIFLLEI